MTDVSKATEPSVEVDGHLTVCGWILILAGVALAIWAFNFDVGVPVPDPGHGGPYMVANADRMGVRGMILASGLALFISGWVALAGGMVCRAIRP